MKRNHYRNIAVLFILGVAFVAYSLTSRFIAGGMSQVVLGLFILGLVCLVVCAFSLRRHLYFLSNWRKILLLVLVLLAGAVAVSGINLLGYNFNRRWDLTKAKQHTLSKETKELLSSLDREVKLTAFYVGLAPKYLEDIFQAYAQASNMISTEIVDPIEDIGYAAQFGNVISGKEKKAIVQAGGERRDIDFTDQPLTEEQLNNAIMRVTRKAVNVYFLTGHGEYNIHDEKEQGLTTLAKMLLANNMMAKKLLLGIKEEIPEDCDVLVVAGPKNNFTDKEKKLVQDYLSRGGDALFLIESVLVTTPDNPLSEDDLKRNPSLNTILNNWGIKINDDIVVDLGSHAGQDVGSPATNNYMAHKAIVGGLDYTFYVRPRSISILPDRRKSLRLAPLVLTLSSESSWGETDRMLNVKFDEVLDKPGPVPIAFVIWEPKEEDKPSDTRIIVVTDADFLTNNYISYYSNAQMGLNMINWLAETDYQVMAGKNDVQVERLDLTSRQKQLVVIILILLPLSIMMMGAVVWIRSRE